MTANALINHYEPKIEEEDKPRELTKKIRVIVFADDKEQRLRHDMKEYQQGIQGMQTGFQETQNIVNSIMFQYKIELMGKQRETEVVRLASYCT